MEEIIVYVAGNPDLYPIEYYDTEDGAFHGMIPELLAEFSGQTGYDIRYYAAGEKDVRRQLAQELQVDMISGCSKEEDFRHQKGEEIVLFDNVVDGEPVTYSIFLTDVAPKSLGAELRSFLAAVTWQERAGILLETEIGRQDAERVRNMPLLISLILCILVLLCGIVLLIRKNYCNIRKMKKRAETDEITGVGNRDYLARNYQAFINDRNRILYSLFYFHADTEALEGMKDQKEINGLMRHMAAVLLENTSDTDILARVSGDGFVLVRQSPNETETEEWVCPVLARIRSFQYGSGSGERSHGRVTAGIYRLRADDHDLDEGILFAAWGAQSACREGQDYRICTDEFLKALREEKKLLADIPQGLEDGEFQLYIQFCVDGAKGRIAGGEALARWEHPERGFLSPGEFVPLMEKEGMIGRLDFYLLEKTCIFLEKLGKTKAENFFISCNFSRETIMAEGFEGTCVEIIEKYQFNRRFLVLEITGKSRPENSPRIKNKLLAVRNLGVRVALDNFGESMASFLDLQESPPDILKLDKSLVNQAGTKTGDIILHGMIRTGKELGMKVAAEGVEEERQAKRLQEMGCDILQGFYFYHPLPDWEAGRRLQKCYIDKEGYMYEKKSDTGRMYFGSVSGRDDHGAPGGIGRDERSGETAGDRTGEATVRALATTVAEPTGRTTKSAAGTKRREPGSRGIRAV